MERGRQNRVELITGLLERMPPDDLATVARAAAALARSLATSDAAPGR